MADRGSFHLGKVIDLATGKPGADDLVVGSSELTTHGVIVGMTGSGKTGLAIVLLEEALLAGIPTLILDPKGDMGNLALTFPDLDAASFRPWVNESDAAAENMSVDDFASKTATAWREGLGAQGIGPERITQLKNAADVTIYTPGSASGVPLNLIGSLGAPPLSWDTEAETLRDEIEGTVTSLLALIGITADPLSSREHVLLANLIENAWRAGRDLDLGTLIGEIQSPPLRKLGVFEIDAFFPPQDRTALALRLNSLVASPSFAAWGAGAALDIQSLLFTAAGTPRAAIVYLAHLSDEERMFVATLVFGKLVTWMRGQSGTSDLRALAYMDEVMGYVPPTAAPPAKKPILTILKQGRAFGLGLVLSTQNPVDLDYKAMANAGTWFVGRLQTENDKARVLEGLRSAAGDTDITELDKDIGALQKRQFMLVSAKDSHPKVFGTRWAMSYLRGPLTKEQVATLMQDVARPAAAPAPAPEAAGAPGAVSAPDAAAAATGELAPDETSVAPAAPPGVDVAYLDPSAPWGEQIGVAAGSTRLQAFIATRVALRYDDTASAIDEQQEFEAVYGPLDGGLDLDSETVVDFDDRDFRADAPAGATYVLPQAPIGEPAFFARAAKDIQAHLVANRALELYRNKDAQAHVAAGRVGGGFRAALRRGRPGTGRCGGRKDQGSARNEARAAREGARAEPAPGRRARYPDEVPAGERAHRGCGRRPRRTVRRPPQRALDHERCRLGGVEARTGRDGIATARYGRGKGAADDRRPAAARAGDPRRGGRDRREMEDRVRSRRNRLDSARGHRCARDRLEARLGAGRSLTAPPPGDARTQNARPPPSRRRGAARSRPRSGGMRRVNATG